MNIQPRRCQGGYGTCVSIKLNHTKEQNSLNHGPTSESTTVRSANENPWDLVGGGSVVAGDEWKFGVFGKVDQIFNGILQSVYFPERSKTPFSVATWQKGHKLTDVPLRDLGKG